MIMAYRRVIVPIPFLQTRGFLRNSLSGDLARSTCGEVSERRRCVWNICSHVLTRLQSAAVLSGGHIQFHSV